MGVGIIIGVALTAALIAVYQSWRFRLDRECDRAWFEQEKDWWAALRETE